MKKFALALIAVVSIAATAVAQEYVPNVVAQAPDKAWSVEGLGEGVYLFRWRLGFYVSPFVLGDGEVLAVDPIGREAAKGYKDAIAAVTDAPVTKIVYSHDHRDHIVGADVLAPNAEIYAHPGTLSSLERRGDPDILKPTKLVDDGDVIDVGGREVGVHYFGPNHGASNIALTYTTAMGTMLQYVDTMEIGIVPYRTLPDTNVGGYIASLEGAAKLDVQWVLGGHSGPGPAVWITNYLNYFRDMEAALRTAEADLQKAPSPSVEDTIARGEIRIDAIVARAVDILRPKYGTWRGFEAWAPLNAQTVRMYMITGN
ncbi:MAG: MBL fold metallo-hydrolase [Rhodobacteraceae bacterium]|nr:MBL fold metallo-hydrolase [Paracoccaceae bacterium]